MSDPQPDNGRYEQAKEILQEALNLAPGARNAYLDGACRTNPALRSEVESLLAAYDAADTSFLASPLDADDTAADHAEPDLTGRRVGAYRLERLLGHGGMGAVYLASRDDGEFTKHVAVKFIRPSIVSPALLKRFRAERQILADVDHPNIARLIDGGTAEGGMPFFIMEYVQGETLAQILTRGPLPASRAMPLALGVAEVLEAVHSRELVFRDLKPSNIMLTESGVKVLDFGIAKIMRGAPDSESTTLTLTQPGRAVGSPRYMSPEQAAGERVDARSDVFAFGVVLFEALTGRLPFTGETRKDYFRNLMAAKPEVLPAPAPARLRAVVDRCLKKSPEERYASGKELADAIRAVVRQTDGKGRPIGRGMWAAIAALSLLVVAFAIWTAFHPAAVAPSLLKVPPRLVATWASNETNPRISPDLKWLSFISDRNGATRIWWIDRALIDRGAEAEHSLDPLSGDVRSHVWSPSSDRIAYVSPIGLQAGLTLTPIGGGKPQVFELRHPDAVLVRWIGDGIYYLAEASLWRFDVISARATEVTTGRGSLRVRNADVSADERHIVFSAPKDTITSLWYAGIDGSQPVQLTEDRIVPKSLRWKDSRAREVVYVSEEGGMVDVWQLDVTTRKRQHLTVSGLREGLLDVSADGTLLLYEQVTETAHLAVIDPTQKNPVVTPLTSDSLSDLLPHASASGREVAFQRSTAIDMALGVDSATIRVSRDGLRGVSEKLADGYAPEVSADGRWVAYAVGKPEAVAELWLANVQSGQRLKVSDAWLKFRSNPFPLARTQTTLSWSPREPRLYFLAGKPPAGVEVFSANPAADGQSIAVEQITTVGDQKAELSDVQVSADGSRLSYLLRSEGRARSELHVVVLARKEDSVPFKEAAGFTLACPGWTADGSVVVLRTDAGQTLTDVLLVKDGRTREAGRIRDTIRGSVVLDPQRRLLYFARAQADRQGLHAFALDTGRERQVFLGEPHGPAFSGIRVLGNGQLLFSSQLQNRDIVSSEFVK